MWYSKYKDNLAHHHKEIFMSFFSLSIYNCETKANRLFLSGFHNIRLLSWSCHHCWASGSSLWRCRELIWSVHLIWLRWGNWFLVTMCLLFRTGASQGKKSSWKPNWDLFSFKFGCLWHHPHEQEWLSLTAGNRLTEIPLPLNLHF